MGAAKNYYQILGIPADADAPAIQAAFRALAKKFHPDGSDSTRSADRFIEIQEAYEVLGSQESKQAYDLARAELEQENRRAEEEACWQSLLQRNPTVAIRHADLARLAKSLAQRYRSGLLSGNHEGSTDNFAQRLESEFLRRHFGGDLQMQVLGKALLADGRRSAAARLAAEIKALPVGRLTSAQRHHIARRYTAVSPSRTPVQNAWPNLAPIAGLFLVAAMIAIGTVEFMRSGPTDMPDPHIARPTFGGPPITKPSGKAVPQETKSLTASRKRILDRLPEEEASSADTDTALARDTAPPEEEITVLRPAKRWLHDRIAPSGGEASN
jgi:curved DNA-binding protein CbpA